MVREHYIQIQLVKTSVAIGTSALDSTTTGSRNVAVGHGALQKNTTGYSNTASGYQALASNNTTGNCERC